MSQKRHIVLLESGDDVLTSQKIFVLKSNIFTIGRSPSNDIVVMNDYLSREHAKLLINGRNACELVDGSHRLRSRNGTFVNGAQVSRQILEHGDLIEFGKLLRGIYLSQHLSDVELFYYLEAISKFSDFSDRVIEQIKYIRQVRIGDDFNAVTKLT